MLDGLRKFSVEAATADWAVVYYSGHGMEVAGTNYLVPVDANFSSGRDGRSQVVSLDQVMAATQGARVSAKGGNMTNVVAAVNQAWAYTWSRSIVMRPLPA